MKKTLLLLCSCLFIVIAHAAAPRPSILVPAGGKQAIEQKIAGNEWARRVLEGAHESVDKYVAIHEKDPEWIVSRLQMYWKHKYTTPYLNGGYYVRAEGEAPVATVRFAGARDWATDHAQPAIEDIKPYMDYNDDQVYLQNIKKPGQPWEWVDNAQTAHHIELMNVDIMTRAMNSAFLYWYTGDEKYARFAYDILLNYTEGLYYRKPPITEVDHGNAHLIGITSFEVIHEKVVDPMTLAYDFLYPYIAKRGADLSRMAAVFQNLADQIILNGVPGNNWNIFQARYITYLALALDDDTAYKNGKGRQYYIDQILNQNSIRQKSLRDVCATYDQQTGIWNESPGYSVSVTKDMLEIMQMIDNDRNDNILREFPIVEKAALASFQYLFPDSRMTAFGDSGYSTLPASTLEMMIAFYRKYGDAEKEKVITAALNELIAQGVYDRNRGGSLYKLFNYVERLDPSARSAMPLQSATFYAPDVNLFIQRNGTDKQHGLMIVNAGTGFNHDHSNGINLELYGKGYPLGPDFAAGTSYWVPDHRDYYARSVAHNTVVVDGVSSNGRAKDAHRLVASYPQPGNMAPLQGDVTYGMNSYVEPTTQALQVRLSSIVRTGPTSGYYVDIFRSAKASGDDLRHEYFYHNLGQSLTLYDADGKELTLAPSTDLTSEGGKLKGYDYLSDKYSAPYSGDIRARFAMAVKDAPTVNMDVWMKGYPDRAVFAAQAPRSLKAFSSGSLPDRIDTLPVPTLIVRQNGEAWKRPFVAVYEPNTSTEGSSVQSVAFLPAPAESEFIGIQVRSVNGREDHVFHNNKAEKMVTVPGFMFAGTYGVASMKAGRLTSLFLGDGSCIGSSEGYALVSREGNATGSLTIEGNGLIITADSPVVLVIPGSRKGVQTLTYRDSDGKSGEVKGRIVKDNKLTVVEFALPALTRAVLEIN